MKRGKDWLLNHLSQHTVTSNNFWSLALFKNSITTWGSASQLQVTDAITDNVSHWVNHYTHSPKSHQPTFKHKSRLTHNGIPVSWCINKEGNKWETFGHRMSFWSVLSSIYNDQVDDNDRNGWPFPPTVISFLFALLLRETPSIPSIWFTNSLKQHYCHLLECNDDCKRKGSKNVDPFPPPFNVSGWKKGKRQSAITCFQDFFPLCSKSTG